MLTFDDMVGIINRISHSSFTFDISLPLREGPYLRVVCKEGLCNVTGKPLQWKGRRWRLSYHMTPGEVVQTAFKAVLTALEHEAREQFTYKGAAVFGPHFDIEKLVELAKSPDGLMERS